MVRQELESDSSLDVMFPSVVSVSRSSVNDDEYEQSGHDILANVAPPIYNKHTFSIGVNGMLLGLAISLIGTLQVFAFPALCHRPKLLSFSTEFFCGFGIWSGAMNSDHSSTQAQIRHDFGIKLMADLVTLAWMGSLYPPHFVGTITAIQMVISSATAVRAFVTKRQSTISRYFCLHILTILVFTTAAIIMVTAFANGYIDPEDKCMLTGHAISAAAICVGFALQVLTFCFTYETIFQGRSVSMLHCCFLRLCAEETGSYPLIDQSSANSERPYVPV